jgi:hypothetical protein
VRYIGKENERELSPGKEALVVIGRHVRFSQRTGKFHRVQFWGGVKFRKEWGWQVHAYQNDEVAWGFYSFLRFKFLICNFVKC